MRELLPILAVLAVAANAYSGTFQTECPPSGQSNEVVHIPHEYDCAKFYKCMNGEKQVQMCPVYSENRRLYFNPKMQVCDWPWNVTCTQKEPDCPAGSDEEIKLSHPYDCSLYYRCKNGKTVEKCPEGQHFDSVRMDCANKEEATCYLFWDSCPSSDFDVVARFPDKSSCDKYYECENEVMISKQCEDGNAFDFELRKCVSAEEATCDPASTPEQPNGCPPTGSQTLPHETQCGLYYECKDGVKMEKECLGGLSFDPVKHICSWPPSSMCNPPEKLPECPKAGSNEARRIPHECLCNVYYECYNGQSILMTCENGTEFDYIRQVCDQPNRVTCFNPKSTVLALDSECPATGTKLIPHEVNSKYYYVCEEGRKKVGMCLDGHCFNDEIEACDFDYGTNCRTRLPAVTTPRNIEPDECPICDCEGCIIRYPNKLNCSLYYQCDNGTKVIKECPDGLHYNPVTEICDWPDNVNCTIPNVCENGNKTHHECNCQKYYECDGGNWILKECPNGTKYDYPSNTCKPDKEAECYPPVSPPTGCNGTCPASGHKIISYGNCTQYCECNNGNGTVINCIKDMYYNPEKEMCDWPENIRNLSCDPFPCPTNVTNSTVPHECSCDLYFICKNGDLVRGECPKGMEYNYEKGVCEKYEESHCYKEPNNDVEIESRSCIGLCPKLDPSNRSVTLPHKNCTKFCRCGAGAPYVVHCPPGLHFSEKDKVCTDPNRANCNQHVKYGFNEYNLSTNTRKSSFWNHILPEFF